MLIVYRNGRNKFLHHQKCFKRSHLYYTNFYLFHFKDIIDTNQILFIYSSIWYGYNNSVIFYLSKEDEINVEKFLNAFLL
jgi:hypothetical protein